MTMTISIHPSLAGWDAVFILRKFILAISIHPPLAGWDSKISQKYHHTSQLLLQKRLFNRRIEEKMRNENAQKRGQTTKNSVRTYRRFYVCFRFAQLQNQFAFQFVCLFCADMCHFVLIAVAEDVEPKAVAIGVDRLFQFVFEELVLTVVEHAFEDGVLHSRPMGDTLLGHRAQALSSRRSGRVDVVSNQNQHAFPSLTST